jgi:uncharacterized membrane protein (UPF0182 family)
LYLRASGGRIPALNRVIVAYKDQIVMEPTLDAALGRIFGGGGPASARRPAAGSSTSAAPPPTAGQQTAAGPATTRTDAALVEQARQHYERALQAQRDGNWALYGEEIKLLGETLRVMSK